MTIKKEISFSDFEPWSGAVDLWNIISNAGKLDTFEAYLGDMNGGEMTDDELNDLLWFDGDIVCDWLWGRDESWVLDHQSRVEAGDDPDEIDADEEEDEEIDDESEEA